MAVGIHEFWNLAVRSGAVTSEQAHALHARFSESAKTKNGDASGLAQWLVKSNVLSRYQASVLLKGVAGPFRFGDFRVADRFPDKRFRQSFRAVHSPTGHPVVLRFYDANVIGNEQLQSALADCVRQLSRLHSPRLQRYFQWQEVGNYRFAVIEELEGQVVARRLEEDQRLSMEEACRVVRQVAEALVVFHQAGRAHGDIRPENIWIGAQGCVHLMVEPLDWLAPFSLVENSPLDTIRLDYAAPELTVAGQALDMRTDLYALGCTFYRLLSGKAPFSGGTGAEKIQRHVQQPVAPLESLGVTSAVESVVHLLMAKNPQARIETPEELIEAINVLVPTSDPLLIPGPTWKAFEEHLAEESRVEEEAEDESAAAPPVVKPAPENGIVEAPQVMVTTKPPPAIIVVDAEEQASELVAAPPSVPVVVDSAPATRTKRRRRRKSMMPWILLAIGLVALTGGGWYLYPQIVAALRTDDRETEGESETGKKQLEKKGGGSKEPEVDPDEKPPAGEVGPKVDDGKSLWADPVAGEPVSLAYVPPGAQLFLVLRPAELEATEGQVRLQAALGPRAQFYREQLEAITHLKWSDIERLVVSFPGGGMSFPRPALVIYLREAPGEAELIQKLGNPTAESVNGKRVYKLGEWFAYLPAEKQGRILVLGSKQELEDVIEFDGAPPVLLRQLTRLLGASNDHHQLIVLGVPNFLLNNIFRDDFSFYFGAPEKVRDALNGLLIDDVNAFLFSVALADPVYAELRLNIGSAPDPAALLKTQRDRFHGLTDQVEERISSVAIPEYWRRVALRYPQMVRFLDEYLRAEFADRQLVFNVVLPRQAPANLLVGAEMLLLSGEATAVVGKQEPKVKTPSSIDELLQAKMSMMFDQLALDFTIRDLEGIVKDTFPDLKFPIAIRILGNDLQLAGITQNQQILNFKEEQKTLSDILTSIVMKANPITTVKKPSEEDQKLVWVVGPDPDDKTKQVILVTTRDAAKSKKFKLPKPFQPE